MKKGGGHNGLQFVVRAYSLLACVSLLVFGVGHLYTNDPLLGWLEVLGGSLFLANIFVAAVPRRAIMARNSFLVLVLLFLMIMLITSGTDHTGAYWFFMFPVAAFFLSDTRRGIWWMLALLGAGGVVSAFGLSGSIPFGYDATMVRQLLFSILVVTTGIYAYQYSLERLSHETEESTRQLYTEKIRSDSIVRHIGEGIVVADTKGKVTYVNPAAENLLGWHAAAMIGKHFADVVAMIDQSGMASAADTQPLYRALQSGQQATTMGRFRRKDGRIATLSVTGQPIIEHDSVAGAVCTFRDVSEEQSVGRTKSEFVTLASHQLRTPLSAVSWLSELLLSGDAGKLTPEQREHVQDIYHSNQRMGELVSEMLIVSSLELDNLPVVPQKTDLVQLIRQIIPEQAALYHVKHTVAEHLSQVPPVQCDPEVIRLLLRSLLSNAFKYTPANGKVTVRLELDPRTLLHEGSRGSVMIAVSDTGYGIPQSATSRIFTKFFRAANIIHKDTDGTGLGLYIVKSLLDYVGGRISFDSVEGKGTTFTMWLPIEGMAKHEIRQKSVGRTTRRGVLAAGGGLHA